MNRKITVIGAGSVGSATAFALTLQHTANEILLIDIDEERAKGEAMDILQGTPILLEAVKVYAGDYEAARGSDIVVITSGVGRKPGQTRTDLAQVNANIIKDIAPKITAVCPDATYIIVANPVDVLTQVFLKVTGLPEYKVLGSGTLLDTSRLRSRIAEYLKISPKNVRAYVFGEHGETSFVPWSLAQISTVRLDDYKNLIKLDNDTVVDLDHDEIETYMRTSGSTIIARKGYTNYAIAISVCSICEAIFSGVNAIATVSTMLHGEYGIEGVCLSLPTVLGSGRVQGRITPKLTEDEVAKLRHSADALKGLIETLDF